MATVQEWQRGIALAMHTLAQRIIVLRAEVKTLEGEILGYFVTRSVSSTTSWSTS